MIGKLILVCCLLIAFTPFSFAGIVDCKKDKGNEEHCINAKAGDKYQCTTYVQNKLDWVGRLGISLKEKQEHKYYKDKSKTQACIGGVAVIAAGSYGHVGIVDADIGSMIRIKDRNYCCDGVEHVHEISKSKVTGYICQSQESDSYHIRISNIDDEGECSVNGEKVATVGYYGDTGWVDITKHLHPGDNKIKFKVKNKEGGFTYYFAFKESGDIKWKKSCGKVGSKGCDKKLSKGKTLTKEFKWRM